ncbi:MAG TPA: ubiquitin-like protein UBact [Chthonomonadales bacterium]|nr:ubiquitin-like protein UBact [Chthonomonadales bacterium]
MVTRVEDRLRRPVPRPPDQKEGDGDGPVRPQVERPDTRELLKRMRRIDPDTARRYRQRSGE